MRLVRFSARCLLTLTAALLYCSAGQAQAAWNLEEVSKAFTSTNAVENHVCLVHDGWQIAFLSHNQNDISALFITEQEGNPPHAHPLDATIERLVGLIGMENPEKMELKAGRTPAAIVIDAETISQLGDEAEHVFSGSPLEGMAYLLSKEFFYIHGIRPNGYLHWKTVRKSGVDLLMPMAPRKLTAIEVTGRQEMDEYASEVLARKLGLGSNTGSISQRAETCRQLKGSDVPYMNKKRKMIGIQKKRRYIIGQRQTVGHMLANRYGGTLLYPSQPCDWPQPPSASPEPTEPEATVETAHPLSPQEAREAYMERLRALKH